MIVDELKKSIILSAISGKLSVQNTDEIVSDKFDDYRLDLPFSIPNNWRAVTLKDITDYGKKVSVVGTSISDESWVLELEDIEKDTGILLQKIYQKDRKAISNKNKFVKDNVLYGKLRPYLNKCIIADQDGFSSTEIVPMNLDSAIISKYLKLVLISPYFLNYVNEKAYGTKMPRLGTKDAQNSVVPLPPMEEQQRIVDKVEELFSKLDEIKTIEDELNKLKLEFPNDMKKSILKDAFDGKYSMLSFNSWSTDKLINACDEICTGNSISENIKKTKYTNLKDGYNYIGTKDLNFDHSFEYENGIKIPFEERNFKYAFAGDILLCIEGGSAGKKIGILNEKVCYGNKLCKFSSSKLNSKFLYYYLQSPQFVKNFYDNISGIIGGVSINKIKTIEISFPPIEEQKRIVDRLEQLLPLCDDIEKIINAKEK